MWKQLLTVMIFGILLIVNPITTGKSNSNILDNKSQIQMIDVTKISIGGIKLGMTEKEIIKKLGKPKSRTAKMRNCLNTYDTIWNYDGLEITFSSHSKNESGRVEIIITSSPLYPTEKGIKIGDDISKAKKAYSTFARTTSSKDLLVYGNDDYGGGLSFATNQRGKIREIKLIATGC
jgi:hypothetical protein